MSLQELIETNRGVLLERTRAKAAMRGSPGHDDAELEHGVPVFLRQLIQVLQDEVTPRGAQRPETTGPKGATDDAIGRSAGRHGQDLRKFGFSLEQVVNGYGDVCQAVTELALEKKMAFTVAEFHTLNRCLDNAIAKAVTSWNEEREESRGGGPSGSFEQELEGQLNQGLVAFAALRAGHVGPSGATAIVLERALNQMHVLLDARRKK